MKTINLSQAIKMGWCYGEETLRKIVGDKEYWTALDILTLKDIPCKDRLYTVLTNALIDAHTLHEFACRCAERALARLDNPDQGSIAAIAAKRSWMRGEISSDNLRESRYTASFSVLDAASGAAWYAAMEAAWYAALYAAQYAANSATWHVSDVSNEAVRDAERKWQIEELIKMLGEEK